MIAMALVLILGIPAISASASASQNQTWSTYEDPILQFSIDHPSTWNIIGEEDEILIQNPERFNFSIATQSLSTLDPSEYARGVLNLVRGETDMRNLILNETTINGHPAYRAQFQTHGIGNIVTNITSLMYFMVTDDYTGYTLMYAYPAELTNTKYSATIERMVDSFKITK
jgi:hypothetical protein